MTMITAGFKDSDGIIRDLRVTARLLVYIWDVHAETRFRNSDDSTKSIKITRNTNMSYVYS